MQTRSEVKQAYERYCVEKFITWMNATRRSQFEVIEEPDPPEAIIRSNRTVRWIEIATAFWNNAYAKDLYSRAVGVEVHQPVSPGPYMNMDEALAKRFMRILKKKLTHRPYIPFKERYGQGYLLISIEHPFYTDTTLDFMREAYHEDPPTSDLGCFRSIYLLVQAQNTKRIRRWMA